MFTDLRVPRCISCLQVVSWTDAKPLSKVEIAGRSFSLKEVPPNPACSDHYYTARPILHHFFDSVAILKSKPQVTIQLPAGKDCHCERSEAISAFNR